MGVQRGAAAYIAFCSFIFFILFAPVFKELLKVGYMVNSKSEMSNEKHEGVWNFTSDWEYLHCSWYS